MNTKTMFSSRNDTWETPQDFFDKLDDIFHFDIDVCATADNAKCSVYYTPEDDGLQKTWKGTCWCNPPYGRNIREWIKKTYETAKSETGTVVCLIPSRTDTKYWHDYVMKATGIFFVRGRLKFGNSKNSAPFPSAVVVFKKGAVPEEWLNRDDNVMVNSPAALNACAVKGFYRDVQLIAKRMGDKA